jgi:hypothetical protein
MTYSLTKTKVLELECALARAVEQEKLTREENEILRKRLAKLEKMIRPVDSVELESPQADEEKYVGLLKLLEET